MSRTHATIKQSLIAKLPPGFALAKRDGVIDAIYSGFARSLAEGEEAAEMLVNEIDPRRANYLLADFERVLAADPCGRDFNVSTTAQRQRRAHQRWTATGGQSIPYFIEIARNLGVDIRIEEFWPSIANDMEAGSPLIPEGEQFVWLVRLKLIDPVFFIAGQNEAGERLYDFTINDVECVLRRLKPAHTTLVFFYEEQKNG